MDPTIEEQAAVIKSLFEEGEKPVNIFQRLKSQFADACMTSRTFYNLIGRYRNGRTCFLFIYLFASHTCTAYSIKFNKTQKKYHTWSFNK